MTAKFSLICTTTEQRERVLRECTSPTGVEITVHVGGARNVLSVMQKEQPDVLLLDMDQPDESAFELIDAATQRVPGVLVLLVSADASMAALKRAMRAGVRDVLPAPLSTDTLKLAQDYLGEARANTSRFSDSTAEVHAFMSAKGGCGATFLAAEQLPQAALVVRLRSGFSREQFVSATSDALKGAVRAELTQLLGRILVRPVAEVAP